MSGTRCMIAARASRKVSMTALSDAKRERQLHEGHTQAAAQWSKRDHPPLSHSAVENPAKPAITEHVLDGVEATRESFPRS